MGSRNWCFTLNNPDGRTISPDVRVKLMLYNLETSESGTPHYQGYVEFNHPVRMSALAKLIPGGHFETRKGTKKQAIMYCLKNLMDHMDYTLDELSIFGLVCYGFETDIHLSDFVAALECDKPGNKLNDLKLLIDAGATDAEIAHTDFGTFLRYHRGISAYRMCTLPDRNHKMEVIVIYGPTGTGKSKYAHTNFPQSYWKQASIWWDGYHQQETIIFDEFYGWMPFNTLLRVCDRYPMLLESKGGQIKMSGGKRIVITSNTQPCCWYKDINNFSAFVRRVDKWIYMPELGEELSYNSYDLFNHATNVAPIFIP